MNKKICDRCGSDKCVDENELIDFFEGSIQIDDVDLCQNCFEEFAIFITKFVQVPNKDTNLATNEGDGSK